MNAIEFERIYVPPFHNEQDSIEKLIRLALEKGFKHLLKSNADPEKQIQELIEKKSFLVLEKFKKELTISSKGVASVMPRLCEEDIKIYNLEKATEWIIAKAKEIE
jgi:hypothetical protein